MADDLAILIIEMCLSTTSNLMQSALILVQNWCLEHTQTVNPSKTKLILLTKKKFIQGFGPPAFLGASILLSDFIKSLGWLEPNLNWTVHVKLAIAILRQSRSWNKLGFEFRSASLEYLYLNSKTENKMLQSGSPGAGLLRLRLSSQPYND